MAGLASTILDFIGNAAEGAARLPVQFSEDYSNTFANLGNKLAGGKDQTIQQNMGGGNVLNSTLGFSQATGTNRQLAGDVGQIGAYAAAPLAGKVGEVVENALPEATSVGSKILTSAAKGAAEGAAINAPANVAQGIGNDKNPNAKNLSLDFLEGAGEGAAFGGVLGGGAEAIKNRTPLETANQAGAVGGNVLKPSNQFSQEDLQKMAESDDSKAVEKQLKPVTGDIVAHEIAPAVAKSTDPNVAANIIDNALNKKLTPEPTGVTNPSPSPTPLPPTTSVSDINTPQQVQEQGSTAEQNFMNAPDEKTPQSAQVTDLATKANEGTVKSPEAQGKVQQFLGKNKVATRMSNDIAQDANAHYSAAEQRMQDSAKLLNGLKNVTDEDKEAVYNYREAKSAGTELPELSDSQKALQDRVTEITHETNLNRQELAKMKVPGYTKEFADDTGNHRIALGKGAAIERFNEGEQQTPLSGRSLRTTTSSGKARRLFSLTDEEGNRSVASIKNVQFKNPETGAVISRGKLVNQVKDDGNYNELGKLKFTKYQDLLDNDVKPFQRKLSNIQKEYKALSNVKTRGGVSDARITNLAQKVALLEDARNFGEGLTKSDMRSMRNATLKLKELTRIKDVTTNATGRLATINAQAAKLQNIVSDITNKYDPDKLEDKVFIGKDGKKYTIGQATSNEITDATGQKYLKDPLTSSIIDYNETANALDSARMIEGWKSNPDFNQIGMKLDEGVPPHGWKTTKLPQMQGYSFDPRAAEVLDDIYGRIQDKSKVVSLVNHAMRNMIVAVPIRHNLNELGFYFTDRGLSSLINPFSYIKGSKALVDGFNDVMNQSSLYRQVASQGFNFMAQDDHAFADAVSAQTKSMLDDPETSSRLANDIGTTAKNLRQVWSEIQHKGVWVQQDMMNMARIRERMNGGMNLEDAVEQTRRFNPQYQVPSRVAGSRAASLALRNNNLLFFGSYHYDQWKVLANMLKDVSGRNGTKAAIESADKLAALSLGVWATHALIDKGVQSITGNTAAYTKPFGDLDVADQIQELVRGQKNISQFGKSQIFPASVIGGAAQLYSNKSSTTGEDIIQPDSSIGSELKQLGNWAYQQTPIASDLQKTGTGANIVGGTLGALGLASNTNEFAYAPQAAQTFAEEVAATPGVPKAIVNSTNQFVSALGAGDTDRTAIETKVATALIHNDDAQANKLVTNYNKQLIDALMPWAKAGGTQYLNNDMITLLKDTMLNTSSIKQNLSYDLQSNPQKYGVPISALASQPATANQ